MNNETSETPEVETRQIVRWIADPTTVYPTPAKPDPGELPIRPMLRASVPVLTALDDGTMAEGEEFRLRQDRFTIGRSEGDFIIPIDRTLSGKHAEIRRVENRGKTQWLLVDLNTANGTFVRANSADFFADTIVILGARRFRLVHPGTGISQPPDGSTTTLDKRDAPTDLWPTLAETGTSTRALAFPLRQHEVTIGRLDGKCGITIDDPHLAKHHATITKTANGTWKIGPAQTTNGVWVNIRSVPLTSHCYFRCGEQFFRFVIP